MIYELWLQTFRFGDEAILIDVCHDRNRGCHPFRAGYAIKVVSTLYYDRIPGDKHSHAHQDYCDQVRHLSQVSHQMRAEVGELFWKHTNIHIDHWEYLFIGFLQDRPLVAAGIKVLTMFWHCKEDETALDHTMIKWCEYASPHLVLDNLRLHISAPAPVAKRIVERGDSLKWIQALKKIKMKEIAICFYIDPPEVPEDSDDDPDNTSAPAHNSGGESDTGTDDGNEEDRDALENASAADDGGGDWEPPPINEDEDWGYESILAERLNPLMEAIILPPRPCPSPITAEALYLQTRLNLGPDSNSEG
jgi:hypothetical protein